MLPRLRRSREGAAEGLHEVIHVGSQKIGPNPHRNLTDRPRRVVSHGRGGLTKRSCAERQHLGQELCERRDALRGARTHQSKATLLHPLLFVPQHARDNKEEVLVRQQLRRLLAEPLNDARQQVHTRSNQFPVRLLKLVGILLPHQSRTQALLDNTHTPCDDTGHQRYQGRSKVLYHVGQALKQGQRGDVVVWNGLEVPHHRHHEGVHVLWSVQPFPAGPSQSADGVVEYPHVLQLIQLEGAHKGLNHVGQMRGELDKSNLLQRRDGTASGLLHAFVSVQTPLQQRPHHLTQDLLALGILLVADPRAKTRDRPARNASQQRLRSGTEREQQFHHFRKVLHEMVHAPLGDSTDGEHTSLLLLPRGIFKLLLNVREHNAKDLRLVRDGQGVQRGGSRLAHCPLPTPCSASRASVIIVLLSLHSFHFVEPRIDVIQLIGTRSVVVLQLRPFHAHVVRVGINHVHKQHRHQLWQQRLHHCPRLTWSSAMRPH
mmetsp:Transcript_47495/g.125938  ORF Transcript_47495/g.125938 Transcript_47495/m.125938 type:complete len:488 (+) Transcript_47495:628-2091(+)